MGINEFSRELSQAIKIEAGVELFSSMAIRHRLMRAREPVHNGQPLGRPTKLQKKREESSKYQQPIEDVGDDCKAVKP